MSVPLTVGPLYVLSPWLLTIDTFENKPLRYRENNVSDKLLLPLTGRSTEARLPIPFDFPKQENHMMATFQIV